MTCTTGEQIPGGTYFFAVALAERKSTLLIDHADGLREALASSNFVTCLRLWPWVKHGYVTQASAWPHSSIHRYIRMGWMKEDWGVGVEASGGYDE